MGDRRDGGIRSHHASSESAIRRPAYTPTPVPTVLTTKAVIVPTRAPSHQPIAPPTLAPRKVRTLDTPEAAGAVGPGASLRGQPPWRVGRLQRPRALPDCWYAMMTTRSSEPTCRKPCELLGRVRIAVPGITTERAPFNVSSPVPLKT